MKAQVLNEIGNIEYREIDKPKLSMNDVLVKVKAVGICGSDIPRIYRDGAHKMPIIPGHEFSGEVTVAPGIGAKWKGKRVGVFPLIPCRKCPQCLEKQYEMCRNYDYLGSRSDGAFAEFVTVPRWNLIELPENVSYEAAAMLEPMAVAVHAMRSAKPLEGERICVCGMGTIGLLLTMFIVNEVGTDNIYCIVNKEFQENKALELGILKENICNCKNNDVCEWLMDRTAGTGVNVFFECVGKNETINQAIQATMPGGRVQLVGNPASDISFGQKVYWKILRNQLTVLGSWNSSFTKAEDDDWHYVLKLLSEGAVNPEKFITHKYNLENMQDGLEIMRDKKEEYIKVMIVDE